MRVPVLMYHALSEQTSAISISPAVFTWQMQWLHGHGYRVLSLRQLIQLVRQRKPLPRRTAVITFDDGLESVYTHACPVLQQYGFTATVFLVPAYIAKTNDWPSQPPSIARFPLMTWAQIEEMGRYGVLEYGAHTMTHPYLDQLAVPELEQEIVRSKEMLQENLGQAVDLFAYPYGRFSPQVKSVVHYLFAGACTTHCGLVTAQTDPLEIERIEAGYLSTYMAFANLASPLLPLYLALRSSASLMRHFVARPL